METINNIPQLIQFIETHHLNSAQICHILHKGYMLFGDEEKTPQELIEELKDWDLKYGKTPGEKPLFLDSDFKSIMQYFIKWEPTK